jgi:hypothetical protein
MKIFKAVTILCCVALMGAALATSARADDYNRKTVITFGGPVEIPAVHLKGWRVLPAGTYVFKIVDSQSDRDIVQIFSEDEKTVYATVLAIPNFRLKVTSKTVVTFRERPAGEPQALRAWFYPGRNWGEEFVYPKAIALEIAKSSDSAVLYTPAELPLEVTEPIRTIDEPAVAQLREAPVAAIQPTGEEVELAQVVTPPPAEALVASAALPASASNLPLIGLVGLMALSAAFALRAFTRRTV